MGKLITTTLVEGRLTAVRPRVLDKIPLKKPPRYSEVAKVFRSKGRRAATRHMEQLRLADWVPWVTYSQGYDEASSKNFRSIIATINRVAIGQVATEQQSATTDTAWREDDLPAS